MNITEVNPYSEQRTKTFNPQKLLMSVLIIVISFATLATMRIRNNRVSSIDPMTMTADFTRAASAPYQDGLYLGSLAAKQGKGFRISAGRWRTKEELEAFGDGYRSGFSTAAFQMAENDVK